MTTNSSPQYSQQAWSLDDLFPAVASAPIKTALSELDTLITNFEAYQATLTENISAADFKKMLDGYEHITRQINRLGGFAS